MIKTDTPMAKPGEIIKQELHERGISQKEFAKAAGIGQSHVSDILSGRRRITLSLAVKIEELLGIPSQLIIASQTTLELASLTSDGNKSEECAAKEKLDKIDSVVSVKSLLKFLKRRFKTNVSKLKALEKYYNLTGDVVDGLNSISKGCYRKSMVTGLDKRMIDTWVVMAHACSNTYKPKGVFDISNIRDLCTEVAILLHNNEANLINHLVALLSENGIGLIRINKVERASIDGYSFFNKGVPYIVLTCRYDRIDNLAFTLLHELGHLALGHTSVHSSQLNIDLRSEDEEYLDAREEEANNFAGEILIPGDLWKFAPSMSINPRIIQNRYMKWAQSKNLNPWIVLGRVSHETGMYKFRSDDTRKINGGKEECYEIVL